VIDNGTPPAIQAAMARRPKLTVTGLPGRSDDFTVYPLTLADAEKMAERYAAKHPGCSVTITSAGAAP
jgi:hypothetical protein